MRVTLWNCLGLAYILLICACSPQQAVTPVVSPRAATWCDQIHEQITEYRQQQGLARLKRHSGLDRLALQHSGWLAAKRGTSFMNGSNVSHSGSHYRSRISRLEYGMEAWGENVAYISNTPDEVAYRLVTMWQASPPHQKALVGNWTHIGIAIHIAEDGAIFSTLNFGRLTENQNPR